MASRHFAGRSSPLIDDLHSRDHMFSMNIFLSIAAMASMPHIRLEAALIALLDVPRGTAHATEGSEKPVILCLLPVPWKDVKG